MKKLLLFALCFFSLCGCSTNSNIWPTVNASTRGWGVVIPSDFERLKIGDSAADVIRKLGQPAASAIALPWLPYTSPPEEKISYAAVFELRGSNLRPTDKLIRVVVLGNDEYPNGFQIWPRCFPPSKEQTEK